MNTDLATTQADIQKLIKLLDEFRRGRRPDEVLIDMKWDTVYQLAKIVLDQHRVIQQLVEQANEQEWLKVGDNVYIASRGEIDATPLIQPDLEPPPTVNGRIVWTMKAALWNCTEAELARLVEAARDLPYVTLSNENGGVFTVELMLEVLRFDTELLEVFEFAQEQGAVYLIASVLK